MVTSKLAALQAYQLSIGSPPAPAGTFDATAAARGRVVFEGMGKCATCHSEATFTDAPGRLHAPTEVVTEPEPNNGPSFASRSATKMYRTTPLRGLWQHAPYFHNGVAASLEGVVDLYNTRKALNLTAQQRGDLVQYLKSL
jgi:cytochrome c peroxidase